MPRDYSVERIHLGAVRARDAVTMFSLVSLLTGTPGYTYILPDQVYHLLTAN